jgi:hypothetical protein
MRRIKVTKGIAVIVIALMFMFAYFAANVFYDIPINTHDLILVIVLLSIFIIIGAKDIIKVETVVWKGTSRIAMVVNYCYHEHRDNHGRSHTSMNLIMAYLNDNNKIVVNETSIGNSDSSLEKQLPLGSAIDIKEYDGKVVIMSEHGREVPAELKVAADAYYEEHGDWNPRGGQYSG